MSDSGLITLLSSPLSCHTVRILKESLPTGIVSPRSGQNSSPTVFTVSNKFWFSSGSLAAAIQLAESLMSLSFSISLASILVIVSPIAIRADAGESITASGVRSPIAIASPKLLSKVAALTATSATGTCHGPTIWSRTVKPPTLRSPIVIKNFLLPTAGKCSTRFTASAMSIFVTSTAGSSALVRVTSRVILGGLPNSVSIGMSIGLLLNKLSCTINCFCSVASPTTANGQRSRSQIAVKRARSSSVRPIT